MNNKFAEFFTPMKAVIIILIVIILWMISGLFLNPDDHKKSNITIVNVNYKTIIPKLEIRKKYIKLTGTTEAQKQINLTTEASGHILSLNVKDGDFLNQGDIILHLSPKGIDELFKAAEADLKKAEIAYETTINLQKKGWDQK